MGIHQSTLITRSVAVLSERPLDERLETATLNTILGLGTVFSVLILIIFIIYLFNLIPYIQDKLTKKTVSAVPAEDNVIAHITKSEDENLVDDNELVAVITAAIYASIGDVAPADGFVVRSIRKVNSGR